MYKISRDSQGARLTWLKVTGGSLAVKTVLSGDGWSEKVDQIRLYSGAKFTAVPQADAGTICAVTGLTRTFPGQGFGGEPSAHPPVLEPVLTYQVLLPQDADVYGIFLQLQELAEEEPQLHIVWNEQLKQIHLQLMGEVQLEVLQSLVERRFGWQVWPSRGVQHRQHRV